MESQEGPKKRKAASLKRDDDDDNNDENEHPDNKIMSVKVEHEDGENASILVPPDVSNLPSIHKILLVDFCSDDKDLVEKAMKELADLCKFQNDNRVANRQAVCKAGGAFAIVGAMRNWYNNHVIQREGCLVLASAAKGKSVSHFRLAAKEVGALEVVVSAMKNYPGNRLIQAFGCAACGNLCLHVEENADHLVNDTNGLERILAAMRKFPDDIDVQRFSCNALKILSERKEFRARINDIGGCHALLDAIQTHKDETKEHVKKLQEWARKALKNLL